MQKLKLHPDLGGDEWNASLLNEAYSILSNPHKRAAYDSKHLKGKMGSGPHTRKQATDKPDLHKRQRKQSSTRHSYSSHACQFCGTPKPVRFRYGGLSDCTLCSSPLQTVAQLRSTDNPRRSVQRTPHNAPIVYFTGVNDLNGKSGIIRDLSTRGLKFLSATQVMEEHVLKITSNILSATARVIYCRPSNNDRQYVIGVEFITLRFNRSTGTFLSENA